MNVYKITAGNEATVDPSDIGQTVEDLLRNDSFNTDRHFNMCLRKKFEHYITSFDGGKYTMSNSRTGPFVEPKDFDLDDCSIDCECGARGYNGYIAYDVEVEFYIQTDMDEDTLTAYCNTIEFGDGYGDADWELVDDLEDDLEDD